MNDVELIYQLTKRLDFTNVERIMLIKELWKDYVVQQDWDYGANEQIEKQIRIRFEELEQITRDNI